MHRSPSVLIALLLIGCSDTTISKINTPPTATITSHDPGEAAAFQEGGTVTVIGQVSDEESELEDMTVSWGISGDLEPLCEAQAPDEYGRSMCTFTAPQGDGTLVMTVTDEAPESTTDELDFTVTPTDAPVATITAPGTGSSWYAEQAIILEGTISDTEDDPGDLTVWWESDVSGVLPVDTAVTSEGIVTTAVTLDADDHYLTLHVEDTDGKTAIDGVTVKVGPANSAPDCAITAPITNTAGEEGITVLLSGVATDGDIDPTDLVVVWQSDRDGELSQSAPTSSGEVSVSTSGLSLGTHTLTMTAADEVGATCSDLVVYTVGRAPEIAINEPKTTLSATEEDPIDFHVTVSDESDDPADIALSWALDEVVLSEQAAASDGEAAFSSGPFSSGSHELRVTATDTDGLSSTASVTFTVDACTDIWYADADSDGFGDLSSTTTGCAQPSGYVADATDCDDSEAATNPGASEVCDGADNDCDGSIDEGVTDTFYADGDSDGYGDAASTTEDCAAPSGYVLDDTDCDDDEPAANPGASEVCDGIDNDCDGSIDEGVTTTFYADADGDGFGDLSSTTEDCSVPSGYTTDTTDCDDSASAINPDADEICDGLDNDCDGDLDLDDSSIDLTTALDWYADVDSDGYGDADSTATACDQPSGYVSDSTDCDDSDRAVNPGESEVCNEIDDDCDGSIDEDDAEDAPVWYADADSDGFGDADSTAIACDQPSGHVSDDADCDDDDDDINPDAEEECEDGIDNDCDGSIDEGCPVSHCSGTSLIITSDETWSGESLHEVDCDVYIRSGATLTIEDGATVELGNGYRIFVGDSSAGTLSIEGSTTDGVVLTGIWSTPGYWGGIDIGSYGDATIAGATIEYAGHSLLPAIDVSTELILLDSTIIDSRGPAIDVDTTGATLAMQGSTIEDNGAGVILVSTAALAEHDGAGFVDNIITGNGEVSADYPDGGEALELPAESVGLIESSCDVSGNALDRIVINSNTVTESAVWVDVGADYYASMGLMVQDAASEPVLTLDDGVTIAVAESRSIQVGRTASGGLLIDGHTEGVTLTSAAESPAAGDWGYLELGASLLLDDSAIDGLSLQYAGASSGALYTYGFSATDSDVLSVTNSTITDSGAAGVYFYSNGRVSFESTVIEDAATYGIQATYGDVIEAFTDSIITGSGSYAAYVHPDEAASFSDSSTYTGNASDAILLTTGTLQEDTTWQGIDVPYEFSGGVYFWHSTDLITFTLEDGADLTFQSGTNLNIGYNYGNAALIVEGTDAGVTMTSAESVPAAGDWVGLLLNKVDLDESYIEGLTIAHTGSYVHTEAALYVNGTSGSLQVCDLTLHDGEGDGIYVGSAASIDTVCAVSISDFTGDGVHISNNGGTAESLTELTITDCGDDGIDLSPETAEALADPITVSGSGLDGARLNTGSNAYTVTGDVTWSVTDIPLVVQGDLNIQDNTNSPVLTIEPGVTVQFESGASLMIGANYNGGIVADGSGGDEIIFSSAETSPAAGDWGGLYCGGKAQDCAFLNVLIEYGSTDYSAGLTIHDSFGYLDTVTIDETDGHCLCESGSATTSLTSVTYGTCSDGDTGC